MDEPERAAPARAPNLVRGPTARRDRIREAVLTAVGAGVGLVLPGAGGPSRSVLEQMWGSAFDRRVATFIDMLFTKVAELELADEEIRDRLRSETTAAVGVLASEAASRAGDDEKIERVAAALTNIVAKHERWTGQVDHAQTLMRIVGDTTSTQFALLDYLNDPEGWRVEHGIAEPYSRSSLDAIVGAAFPQLAVRPVVLNAALGDLSRRGLLSPLMGTDGLLQNSDENVTGFLSPIGRELFGFVQVPR